MNKNKIYSIKTCLKTKTHIQNSLLILQIHAHIKGKIKHTRGGIIRGGELEEPGSVKR